MKQLNIVLGLLAGCMTADSFAAESANNTPVKLIPMVKHDVSQPLKDMMLSTEPSISPVQYTVPLYTLPLQLSPMQSDLVDESLQPTVGLPLNTVAGINFQGVGVGLGAFLPNVFPPDPNASVGLTQVVQWVNTSYAVFNKATGALVAGPTLGNQLWAGFGVGDPCFDQNRGDPIVKYDRMANRWVMTQFAFAVAAGVPVAPFIQCIAVSQTGDATGAYNIYEYDFGTNFNDYGKLGVWPDAYYMLFNMFPGGAPDEGLAVFPPVAGGPAACAFDRVSMLAGVAANPAQCFQPNPAAGIFLPSDLDGAKLPPAGAPNYFVGLLQDANGVTSQNSLALWKFHVDWVTPANSTFTGPTALEVNPFNAQTCTDTPANVNGDCAVQPGTDVKLEVLFDRPMYRLAYRNFGSFQSLVVNHNVQAGNQIPSTRWYEIRLNQQGTAVVYQQGTYSQHDVNARWMGSIAMDKLGNMALGYSVSGPTVFPSVRYTGRVFTDPLNTMRTEKTIVNGGGHQLPFQVGQRNRWGDYSSMAIDPSDDCTFWYTNEYIMQNGNANWSTRIASFKFPNCH